MAENYDSAGPDFCSQLLTSCQYATWVLKSRNMAEILPAQEIERPTDATHRQMANEESHKTK